MLSRLTLSLRTRCNWSAMTSRQLANTTTNSQRIRGKATPEGTLSFVKDANLPLYHKFDKTGLYINPIVHAQPQPQYMIKMHAAKTGGGELINDSVNYMRSAETDNLAALALGRNRSNCLYVYSYNSKQGDQARGPNGEKLREPDHPFYLSNLDSLLVPSGFKGDISALPKDAVSRECVVTVADIGCTLDPYEIRRRVEEALHLTKLVTIDCVVWRATEDCMFDIEAYDACVVELDRLCSSNSSSSISSNNININSNSSGNSHSSSSNSNFEHSSINTKTKSVVSPSVQFFGIYFYNIPPYSYYTPPRALEDISSLFPSMIEADMKEESGSDSGSSKSRKYSRCDLLLYKISPAHSFPGTYPMLDSDYGDQEKEEEEESGSSVGSSSDGGQGGPRSGGQSPLSVMQNVKASMRQSQTTSMLRDNAVSRNTARVGASGRTGRAKVTRFPPPTPPIAPIQEPEPVHAPIKSVGHGQYVDESTGDPDLDAEVDRVFREQEEEEEQQQQKKQLEQQKAAAAAGSTCPIDGDGNDDERMLEANRHYTRGAVDCLHCFPGTGAYDRGSNSVTGEGDQESMETKKVQQMQAHAEAQARGHCGAGEEEEETNKRHSSGSIAAILSESGPTPDAVTAATGTHPSSSNERGNNNAVFDAILAKTQRLMREQGGTLTKEQNNAIYAELLDAANDGDSDAVASGSHKITKPTQLQQRQQGQGQHEDSEIIVDEETAGYNPTILLSSLYGPEVELPLHAVLEHLCPPLKHAALPLNTQAKELYGLSDRPETTSTLQHKAMRIVYSVGVDVLIMDSYTSAALGKVDNITVHDLLTAKETSRVFGQFGVPKMDHE